MIGILCEKATAADKFAKALGGRSGIFEGEPYVIANTFGHIFELKAPDAQVPMALKEQYASWEPDLLPWDETQFKWERQLSKGHKDTLARIKKAFTGCDEIVIATDDDPSGEGDLLAWEILEYLQIPVKKYTRAYFEDESVSEILKAMRGRKQVQMYTDPAYLKAWFRTRWDMLSMQWTRLATKFGDGRSVIRQGRLKSAMVQIVGDGLAAVAAYKRIPEYQNRFRDENGVLYTNPEEPLYKTEAEVPRPYHDSPVIKDSAVMKKTAPPKLVDLSTLSARLAPKGFTASQVLKVYQEMYQDLVVSYPRTEDAKITIEQFNDMAPLVDKIAAVIGVDSNLLTHRQPRNTHIAQGMSHGANRPGKKVPASLDALEAKYGKCGVEIYKILAASFLAMFAEDYEYEAQTGHVKDYPKFVGKVSVPKKIGWKAVFRDEDDVIDDCLGLGTQASPIVFEVVPPKPPTPTQKWLMAQLKRRNIGTGATRTSTYADVTNARSKYPLLVDKRGKITMADCGEMSYHLLPGTHIGSLDLTEKVWAQMKEVEKGIGDADVFLSEVASLVIADRDVMRANGEKMRSALGVSMKAGASAYVEGVWNGQEQKFKRNYRNHEFTDDEVSRLFAGEKVTLTLTAKSGSKYTWVCWLSPDCEYNGRKYFGVTGEFGKADDKTPSCPAQWSGHKFTKKEVSALEAGKTIEVKNLVSKRTGNKYSAKLSLEWREAEGQWPAGWKIVPHFN